jgi:hypothetical protein
VDPQPTNLQPEVSPRVFHSAVHTADFCCIELKLIIEIDGAGHLTDAGRQRDRVRDDFLEGLGYRVVRIAGYDVTRDPSACLEKIDEEVRKRIQEIKNPSPPAPLPAAGRGERKAMKKPL